MQIHELNDFVGALDANAKLAIDNGVDTGKLAFTDLFAGDSAVTLWTGQTGTVNDELTLNDDLNNYEFIDFYYIAKSIHDEMMHLRVPRVEVQSNDIYLYSTIHVNKELWNDALAIARVSDTKLKIKSHQWWHWLGDITQDPTNNALDTDTPNRVVRIDGIITPGNTKGVVGVKSITLAAASWSGGEQTVAVTGLTDHSDIIISPDPASFSEYSTSGVYCSAQATNSLTFTCATDPENDLTVNIAIIG